MSQDILKKQGVAVSYKMCGTHKINTVVYCILLTGMLTVLEQGGGENSLMNKLGTFCAFSVKIISHILSACIACFCFPWWK